MVGIAGAIIATVAVSDTLASDTAIMPTPLRKIVPIRTEPTTYAPFIDEPGLSPVPPTTYPTGWVIPSTMATPEKPDKSKTKTTTTKPTKPDPGTVKPNPGKTKSPEPSPTEVSPSEPVPTVTAPTKS
jgi:hypothetical protein